MAPTKKAIDTLVLDTGAIIRNEPTVSTLQSKAESLYTVPAIISEIRDASTRSRVETLLMPFLTIRQPIPASMKFAMDFARRTGDLAVLSKPDLQIIALTYELECEQNGGDWRLRNMPGQKDLNGPLPEGMQEKPKQKRSRAQRRTALRKRLDAAKAKEDSISPLIEPASENPVEGETQAGENVAGVPETASTVDDNVSEPVTVAQAHLPQSEQDQPVESPPGTDALPSTPEAAVDMEHKSDAVTVDASQEAGEGRKVEEATLVQQPEPTEKTERSEANIAETLSKTTLEDEPGVKATSPPKIDSAHNSHSSSESDTDNEGWITPGNLKQKQAQDTGVKASVAGDRDEMKVAVITTDYAMQNVILQINLNLISSGMMRVKNVRTTALRCHACFLVTKETDKQFCPRCGKPTMNRVSCSTDADGGFQVHLAKNYQYNNRGDRYSIPKPVHGSTNGRLTGGGKGGWGNELILAEDQKEYERAAQTHKREKERNLMDEDYLPGILTGDRNRTGGRIKVGAGRNVNSKKR